MAGEARDEPSSDGHPRRGFQGHRRSFPTARACAAPPAPARTKAKQHTTAKQNSNTHNQCVNSELPALLCQQAQLMTQGAHWCHLCTPGLKAPTISTHSVCVCRGEGLRPAFQLRVRVQGGGFETCVSSSTSASSSLYPGSPGLALPAAARVWSVASASAPRVSSVASSAYQIHNCILLSRTHPRMTRNRTRARPSTRGREVREHDLPSPTLAKRRLML